MSVESISAPPVAIPKSKSPRIQTLDSLRGLAAICVVIAHCFGGIEYSQYIDKSPLYIIKAAHEAVIFFFILSGYVLVYQYGLKPSFNYKQFITLRIFRIYIPYIVAVIVAVLAYLLCQPAFYSDNFIGHQWQDPITSELLLNHFLLIGNFDTNSLLNVMWSLVHEMRIAILFPVLLFIIRLDLAKAIGVCILIFCASVVALALDLNPSKGYNNGYFYTSYYFYMFACGGLIAKNQSYLVGILQNISAGKKVILGILAFFLYTFSHLSYVIFYKINIPILFKMGFVFEDFLTALGAFYFIVLAILVANGRSFLEKRIPLLLGKVSYSLYLIHLPIILLLYNMLHESVSMVNILIIGFIASILLSIVFNRYVEQPAARFGRMLFKAKNPGKV